jgi:type II secretory pathway pseudopilin PulG
LDARSIAAARWSRACFLFERHDTARTATQRARMMKYLRRETGSTLIDSLVTIGIIGVILASGMPKFDPRRQDVNTTLATLLGDFRYTRARSITSGTHFSIKMNSPTEYQVQRHSEGPGGTWPVDTVIETVTLPNSLELGIFPDTIEFNTRGLMVTQATPGISQELYVNLNDKIGNIAHRFTVWPSGQINEDF